MPVEVRVTNQKFLAKLNNGPSFTIDDSTDFSRHLKGGVLEEVKAIFNVQIQWRLAISKYTYVFDNVLNTLSIDSEGSDWATHGFSIGDKVKYSLYSVQINPQRPQITGFVTSITGDEIILGSVVETQQSLKVGTVHIDGSDDYVTGLTRKTALKYDFGLIENNESINFLSKLTNTNQTYLFEGIDHDNPLTFVDGVTQGNNKAAYSGSAKVAFVGLSIDKDYIYNELTVQEFQIEHIFKINPFYRDGEIDSLKGVDVPALDIFNGDMSLKYVLQTEFRTVLNNPNTSMIKDYDTQLGSVGYLDESFNGFKSIYSVSDLVYIDDDTGLEVDKLIVGGITNVSLNINAEDDIFISETPVIVGHTAVVGSDEYANSPNEYSTVWSDNQSYTTTDQAEVSDDIIKNYTAVINTLSQVGVSFKVNLTSSDLKNRLSENQDYLLYYIIKDPSKTVDQGGKVTGRINVNFYNKDNDVSGLFDFDTFDQYPHPYEFTQGVTSGFTNAKTFNESGMMSNGRFWVLNSAELNELKFDIVISKFSDNSWDSLRTLTIDLSDQVTVNGIQQIELDTTRGYILKEGDIFNYLKITTDNNNGLKQYYNIQVGYKIPWQSWLELKDAPKSFYDKEKSFNGLNQKTSNYSMVGTGINLFIDAVDGTFEDASPSNWDLTTLPYTVGTPNQIGSGFLANDFGRTGSLSGLLSFGAASMDQVNKSYSLFDNDTTFDVIEGVSYEITSYISMFTDSFEPSHLDNGAFYFLPEGYTKSQCNVSSFGVTADNLTSTVEPAFDDWKVVKTMFKATSDANIKITLFEELKIDIANSTGGSINIDDISVKEVEYGIKVLFDATVDSTNYVTTSEEIEVYDYDEDDQDPTAFSCEFKTFKKDPLDPFSIIEIAGNVIQDGYTQYQAIFTPLVPLVITTVVNMSDVATLYNPVTAPLGWNRFAHGSKYDLRASPATGRQTDWINQQANDTDVFINTSQTLSYNKNEPNNLYSSDTDFILSQANMGAFYGCYSTEEYEYYSISGTMYSDEGDNDTILYQIAFMVDEEGIEHTLSLAATTGGLLMDINPSYTPNQTAIDIFGFNPTGDDAFCTVALVYDYGKDGFTQLDVFHTTQPVVFWSAVGDLTFSVNRSGDIITSDFLWDLDGVGGDNQGSSFNFNLDSNPLTQKFKGFSSVGFGFHSQSQGGFKDVALTSPQDQYCIEMRIEPKEAQSDFSDNRISSFIEAPQGSLLKEITANNNKATLSYDGTSFIGQCLIETSLVKNKTQYDLSAELRPLDLEQ
tara:strand:+ start:366 stop:4184 length:3819 start_codon:yes stop_codon:yes gene_type:complete